MFKFDLYLTGTVDEIGTLELSFDDMEQAKRELFYPMSNGAAFIDLSRAVGKSAFYVAPSAIVAVESHD